MVGGQGVEGADDKPIDRSVASDDPVSSDAAPDAANAPVVPSASDSSAASGDVLLGAEAAAADGSVDGSVSSGTGDTQAEDSDGDGAPVEDGFEAGAGEGQFYLDDAEGDEDVEPVEVESDDAVAVGVADDAEMRWYILKVQVNREDSIREALERRVKLEALEAYFGDIVVPTEDIAEFTKTGKRRVVKKKLYPGYLMVNMIISDDSWFIVRETPGIGDFTGPAGKPAPMDRVDVERILRTSEDSDEDESQVKTAIPFKAGDRVRVKDGYFENFEGEVDGIDEANGRVTVMINIFGRSTPVELEHWQIEAV